MSDDPIILTERQSQALSRVVELRRAGAPEADVDAAKRDYRTLRQESA